MDIGRYLAELIKCREELVVPGLGTFFKVDIPAQFDQENQVFLPPSEQISFKSKHHDDDTFINYIMAREQANLETVQSFLNQYINNLNELLNSTESIKIDGLGTFERHGKNFSFIPDVHLTSSKYYGLQPQPEITKPIKSFVDESDERQEDTLNIEENTLEEKTELEYDQPSNSKRNLLLTIALILCFIAVLQVMYPELLSFSTKKTESIVAKDSLTTNRDTINNFDTLKTSETAGLKSDTSLIDSAKTSKDSISRFEIIVAAFGKRAEAEDYLKQLAKRGIKAYTLPNKSKEFIKVSVAGFAEEQAAVSELKRVQTDLNKTAWIYKVKPIKNQNNVSITN